MGRSHKHFYVVANKFIYYQISCIELAQLCLTNNLLTKWFIPDWKINPFQIEQSLQTIGIKKTINLSWIFQTGFVFHFFGGSWKE